MTATARTDDLGAELEAAAERLYNAEVALHIARQTDVDVWVKAAAERLHEAVVAHRSLRRRAAAR